MPVILFCMVNPTKTVGFEKEPITVQEAYMKLSTKGRYGLRAILDLAINGETEAVSIQSISQRQNISEAYLEQLMRPLKKAGLIRSVRGAGGGYRMARDPKEISVGDILRALEGDLTPVSCGAVTGEKGCDGADSCVTIYVWQKMNDAIQNAVDSIMLEELIEQSRQNKCADGKVQVCG